MTTPSGAVASLTPGEAERQARTLLAGVIRVVDAHAQTRYDDDGSPFIHLTLDLSTPPSGEETWPLEDFHALRAQANRMFLSARPEVRISFGGGTDGVDAA